MRLSRISDDILTRLRKDVLAQHEKRSKFSYYVQHFMDAFEKRKNQTEKCIC